MSLPQLFLRQVFRAPPRPLRCSCSTRRLWARPPLPRADPSISRPRSSGSQLGETQCHLHRWPMRHRAETVPGRTDPAALFALSSPHEASQTSRALLLFSGVLLSLLRAWLSYCFCSGDHNVVSDQRSRGLAAALLGFSLLHILSLHDPGTIRALSSWLYKNFHHFCALINAATGNKSS